jgi:hypothetical protein
MPFSPTALRNGLVAAVFLVLATLPELPAQELFCRVVVNDQRAQTSDRQVFRDMERAFSRFLSERRWTNDIFAPDERIRCNLMITIDEMTSVSSFRATVQIQASRPVYGTNYESVLLNFGDRDWEFEYVESTPLEFNDNNFISNLTSMLAYYAYVIIGLDYDSFSQFGGEQYFQRALNVVNLAQQYGFSGWQAFQSNRNRYWLVENLLNQQFRSMREGWYTYHRQALDVFLTNPDEARLKVLAILKGIQTINRQIPNSILKISFFDAKAPELANLYQQGNPSVKREAFTVLSEVDPGNASRYRVILEN